MLLNEPQRAVGCNAHLSKSVCAKLRTHLREGILPGEGKEGSHEGHDLDDRMRVGLEAVMLQAANFHA